MPQIEVAFDIDANGIVNVSAKDKGTGKEQQIRIQASGGLSDADIDQMVKDAEANAEADKTRRKLVEAKNAGESLIHSVEKSVADAGDKVSGDIKTNVETAIADLRTALEGDNVVDIEAKTQSLTEAAMAVGQAIYEASEAEEGNEDGSEDDDAIVDADFEDVTDEDDAKK